MKYTAETRSRRNGARSDAGRPNAGAGGSEDPRPNGVKVTHIQIVTITGLHVCPQCVAPRPMPMDTAG